MKTSPPLLLLELLQLLLPSQAQRRSRVALYARVRSLLAALLFLAVIPAFTVLLSACGDSTSGPAGPAEVSLTCTDNGCLREVIKLSSWSKAFLELTTPDNTVVDNGYTLYSVRFYTAGLESWATVAIPDIDPPASGWHIVANAHGTIGLTDVCKLTGTIAGSALAGLFGGRGAIGVSVDYPGLGTGGVHPYLVSDVEGKSTLDAIRATTQWAQLQGIPLSSRSAIVGLSQGGHAAISAAALHSNYASELDLRAVGAAAPASVWQDQWRAGMDFDGPHWIYPAMLTYAWADYYGYSDLSALFASPFVDTIVAEMAGYCLWSPSLGSETTLHERISDVGSEIFTAQFLSAFQAADWTEFPFMAEGFTANKLQAYDQTAPLIIYQGTADTTVLQADTTALVAQLEAGGVAVDYRVVADAGHIDVAFAGLGSVQTNMEESIAWIKGKLDE